MRKPTLQLIEQLRTINDVHLLPWSPMYHLYINTARFTGSNRTLEHISVLKAACAPRCQRVCSPAGRTAHHADAARALASPTRSISATMPAGWLRASRTVCQTQKRFAAFCILLTCLSLPQPSPSPTTRARWKSRHATRELDLLSVAYSAGTASIAVWMRLSFCRTSCS